MGDDLDTATCGLHHPTQAFRQVTDGATVFSSEDRSRHRSPVHLQVEDANGNAQAPHVTFSFVLDRDVTLLGREGGRAPTLDPRAVSKVLTDVFRGSAARWTVVRAPFATENNNGPVDGGHQ